MDRKILIKILERERKEGGFDRWTIQNLQLNMLVVWQMKVPVR